MRQRALLTVIATATLITSAATVGVSPASASTPPGPPIEIEWGNWERGTGVVGLVGRVIHDHPEIQEANGIELELSPYDSLDALYTDLARKRVDVVSAGPSAAAAMAVQGAPVRIVGGLAPTSVSILSDGTEWSSENLEGARIAAMSSTSTWKLLQAWISESFGLEPGDGYELVTSPDNAGAITQVAAGTADFAMAWEPHATLATDRFDNVQIVAGPDDLSPQETSWQFSITVTEDVDTEGATRLMGAVADAVDWMNENPAEVDALAVEFGLEAGVAEHALTEGLVGLDAQLMSDEVEASLRVDFESLVRVGGLESMPDDSFFEL